MQGTKEFLELLTKAKDIRLNISIFFVTSILLFGLHKEIIVLEAISSTLLQGLFFLTSIRIIYALFGLCYDFISNKNKEKKSKEDSVKAVEKMRISFTQLDIFQLFILQELKRQNHISISKGAPLFTLQNLGIIYSPATGKNTESASLTKTAKKLLDSELWSDFDNFKRIACKKFFEGIQPGEATHFRKFKTNTKIKTMHNFRESTSHSASESTFNKYSKSILFTQPQSGYDYRIDEIAEEVLKNIL